MDAPEQTSVQLVAESVSINYDFILKFLSATLQGKKFGATEEAADKQVAEALEKAKGIILQLWANQDKVCTAISAEEYLELLAKSVWKCGFTKYMDDSEIPPFPIKMEAAELHASGHKSPEHIRFLESHGGHDSQCKDGSIDEVGQLGCHLAKVTIEE